MKVKFKINDGFKSWLKVKEWTPAELTRQLKMNNDQQVSQILTGSIEPSMNFLHRVCALTGFDLKDIIDTVRVK